MPKPNDPGMFWDEKFDRRDYRYGTEPNAFVADVLPDLLDKGARVLCVGDGEGRNGVWCAGQGFDTTSLEPSAVGIDKIKALADEQGVDITTIHDQMPSEQVDDESFDALVLTFVHTSRPMRKKLHRACTAAVKPGGVVVLEGFTPAQRHNDRPSGGPPAVEMMFTTKILEDDFQGLDFEILAEETVELSEGKGHRGPADVVRMVGRKPA